MTGPTGFIGLSHLGIVMSLAWASHGRPVVAVDPDAETVDRLGAGDLPISEPGLDELLRSTRPWYSLATDVGRLRDCPLVIVAQDVPTDDANASDLGPVLTRIDLALPHLRPDAVVVVMSQVPVGFTAALQERLARDQATAAVQAFYCVETLVIGDAVRRALEPERFIVGCADPTRPLPAALAEGLGAYGCPVLRMRHASAELAKMAINLYLAGSVAYANSLADLCEAVGADWWEIMPALRLDRRIGPAAYIRPSLGLAGGNLERDLATLQGLFRSGGISAPYLDGLVAADATRFDWVLRQLDQRLFCSLDRPTVGVWGLTYKKDTRSTKNSQAIRLLGRLADRASLRAWDPALAEGPLEARAQLAQSAVAAASGADCLVVMVDWDAFAAADLRAVREVMRRPLVIDCVGILEGRHDELHQLGFEYVTMGRAP
jgi:UDPglucose 6-dehydrogenase